MGILCSLWAFAHKVIFTFAVIADLLVSRRVKTFISEMAKLVTIIALLSGLIFCKFISLLFSHIFWGLVCGSSALFEFLDSLFFFLKFCLLFFGSHNLFAGGSFFLRGFRGRSGSFNWSSGSSS